MILPVQMLLIICCSALTGWIISWLTLQIIFSDSLRMRSLKMRIGKHAATVFQKEFESSTLIEQNIEDPQLFEKLKPEIEKHVDFFLNEKLATIFPLLYKFMGEKTLLQFKNAFMIETELLFPVIFRNYISSLKDKLKFDQLILDRINQIPLSTIRRTF